MLEGFSKNLATIVTVDSCQIFSLQRVDTRACREQESIGLVLQRGFVSRRRKPYVFNSESHFQERIAALFSHLRQCSRALFSTLAKIKRFPRFCVELQPHFFFHPFSNAITVISIQAFVFTSSRSRALMTSAVMAPAATSIENCAVN